MKTTTTDLDCAKIHKKSKDLGYIQWFADAEKRTLKGEQQIFCKSCEKWIWSSEYFKHEMKQ